MRKLIFLLPFFFAPALASAGHDFYSVQPARELKTEAALFYRQVVMLPGNKRLKREARQFLSASDQFRKQARRAQRKSQAMRALNKLNHEFRDLRKAAIYANVPPRVRRQLHRGIRSMSMTLSNVESALTSGQRYALSWSDYASPTVFLADDRNRVTKGKNMRYRN